MPLDIHPRVLNVTETAIRDTKHAFPVAFLTWVLVGIYAVTAGFISAAFFQLLQLRRIRTRLERTLQDVTGPLLKQSTALRDELLGLVNAARSERARVMGTIAASEKRRRRQAEDDDEGDDEDDDEPDRLDALLANPMVQGFLAQKGINLQSIQAMADGQVPQQVGAPADEELGLLG